MDRLNGLPAEDLRNDDFYKKQYGPHVVVTRLGKLNLVHCDNPTSETIQKRIEEVTLEEITGEAWDDDCPLCQMFKDKPGDIVYSKDLAEER